MSEDSLELPPQAAHSERFGFGDNWSDFVGLLSPARIATAEVSLREMLETESLAGKTFLDIGSGSGLFSLAAMRLGAARVVSFDYDLSSVETTAYVRERYGNTDSSWHVEPGDVLDAGYMSRLGTFDVVYAWGVLHHTGDMVTALRHTAERVAPGGQLFVAIYNDQGFRSRFWRRIKRTYNRLPAWVRPAFVVLVVAPLELRAAIGALASLSPRRYVESWTHYDVNRGMSKWHNMVDWVGGYPFEVAKPEEIFRFHRQRGFVLTQLVTQAAGCNEYVFTRPG